jgi:hypothetical protein
MIIKKCRNCQSKELSGFYIVMNFKEDNASQYNQIKKDENLDCKIRLFNWKYKQYVQNILIVHKCSA